MNTATTFSEWIYHLSHRKKTSVSAQLEDGLRMELAIQKQKREAALIKKSVEQYVDDGFSLLYNGTSTGSGDILYSSELTILGIPMACKPDVVLSGNNSSIIIIENKYSQKGISIPYNGWVHNHGQLYCYSRIDGFKDLTVSLQLRFWHYDRLRNPVILKKHTLTDKEIIASSRMFQKYKEEREQAVHCNTH